MTRVADFDFHLPEELIAQRPTDRRDASRMLVLDRQTGNGEIRGFADIGEFLNPGDCLVFNNTRVINARLFGVKVLDSGDGAKMELLLVAPMDTSGKRWRTWLKPGKRVRPGTKIRFENDGDDAIVTVLDRLEHGEFLVEFSTDNLDDILKKHGHVPLPPYIRRHDLDSDKERYQTVYAKVPGAVAAPTAGLHFTPEILENLAAKGVKQAELTLHVGPGTFKPVSVESIEEHKMHSESFDLSEECAETINQTKAEGGRILAIGTTSTRVLESLADESGKVQPGTGATDIFIYPPYRPKSVDMLLTNFHLPCSTLLMLVCAFYKREEVLAAYELAKKENFRFYSYGDCMLLR